MLFRNQDIPNVIDILFENVEVLLFSGKGDHLSNMLMYHGCCPYTKKKMMLSGQIPPLPIPIQQIKLLRGLTMFLFLRSCIHTFHN
jgi:hypothetical protein